jgi:hypothetical protein
MKHRICALLAGALAFLSCAISLAQQPAGNQAAPKEGSAPQKQAWTFEQALEQWSRSPHDPYLQYVVLQLARRQNALAAATQEIERQVARPSRLGRAESVDLFSLFTGALAVQESLQLDAMSAEEGAAPVPSRRRFTPQAKVGTPAPERKSVQISELHGPTIKSHPWDAMLAGKKPEVSPLSQLVPEDFYWVEFHSLAKLLDALEISDLWGTHLLNQAAQEARTQRAGDRIKRQLAVASDPLMKPFYDLAVDEVAAAGSDLFLREGSDVTLLFHLKQPQVFKARMDQFLSKALKERPDAKQTSGTIAGVEYVHVESADRDVNVFAAYPAPDVHVRSNSRVAFERVLETIRGRTADGKTVRRLGDSSEFAYIRTLFPRRAAEEDGFVYLSDPFIRRLVGPELRLTEQRRVLCYNHLRMIAHAALLYQSEQGKPPGSLDELVKAECCPGPFNTGPWRCPDGGTYTLSADGTSGVCSHHGGAHSLRPCCEIPVAEVTAPEADSYNAFLEAYNQYWRTFFDPIALRLQITPHRYRLETIVLPLIDNSIYTALAQSLGGQPEPLDALPVPKRNIFSMAVRFNKEVLLRQAGLMDESADDSKTPGAGTARTTPADIQCANSLRQIGLAMHNYHDAYGRFPSAATHDRQGKPLLSWRVQLLPFLEQESLYKEFRQDEPWDSEQNKKLIARMPVIYRCPAHAKLPAGKTAYVVPLGKDTMFTGAGQGSRLSDVPDGVSNTLLMVEADSENAVIWTKPDDVLYDANKPAAKLSRQHHGYFPALFADGSVHFLRDSIDKGTLRALFTRAGGEVVSLRPEDELARFATYEERSLIPGLSREQVERLGLQKFLSRGIGNQIGLHAYDATPLFDFNLPAFLGMSMGSFRGSGPGSDRPEVLLGGFVIASLTSPVYLSMPVNDAKIVDHFIDGLDDLVAARAREPERSFLPVEFDFYKYQPDIDKSRTIRVFAVRVGPVKWRIFWARIGAGLYIASKPFILDDLISREAVSKSLAEGDESPRGHGMVRMRAAHWDKVLPEFRLGWAENNRAACVANLASLSAVARSLSASQPAAGDASRASKRIRERAERMHTVQFFCPDGGRYELAPDGQSIVCSVHGSAAAPRQRSVPEESSPLSKLMSTFADLTATLTFRDDGLHAVIVVERK